MNPTRSWRYVEPAGPDRNPVDPNAPVEIVKTEQQIIDEYFPYWRSRMLKLAAVKVVEISHEACIDDWVVENWAWEDKE